jgi:hypothetical protein
MTCASENKFRAGWWGGEGEGLSGSPVYPGFVGQRGVDDLLMRDPQKLGENKAEAIRRKERKDTR